MGKVSPSILLITHSFLFSDTESIDRLTVSDNITDLSKFDDKSKYNYSTFSVLECSLK